MFWDWSVSVAYKVTKMKAAAPNLVITAQKMKFSIKDFFSKCD